MRKVICIMTALLLCATLAFTAMATSISTDFAPSISAKDAPKPGNTIILRQPGQDDVNVGDCVEITSIKQAQEKTTDITQEERDLLLDVYEKIADGSMELPLKKGYVIRDLVDVSFEYEDCRVKEEHGHKDIALKEEGVVLLVDFVMNIGKNTDLVVMTYIDGEWAEIENVEINGDGTVTCTFEDICPVAFAVRDVQEGANPDTGDAARNTMGLWIGVMAVCAVALVALVVVRTKKSK